MNRTTKLIALILSVILPGLGQVLLGRFFKGALIYLCAIILTSTTILANHGLMIIPWISPDEIYLGRLILVLIIALLLLWIYNIVDIIKLIRLIHGVIGIKKHRVFRQGLDYYLQGNFRMALAKFSEVVKLDPQDVEGILYLGLSCEKVGKRDKADELLQKYITLTGHLPTQQTGSGKFLAEAIIEITKQTRPLTQDEYTEMKKHTQRGYEVLSSVPGLDKKAALIALQHHERCNGKGYPQGIGILQLDPIVQLTSLADMYEAITHTRPHRAKKPPDEALKMVLELKDQAFTKELVKTLIEELSFYPPGTRVQLNTGEIAEVIAVNKDQPLKPRVRIQTDAQGNNLPKPRELNLAQVLNVSVNRVIT